METPKMYLEHANISTNDIEQSKHFFQTAFPHFKVRGGGQHTRKWIHFGDELTYIAITETEEGTYQKDYAKTGVNHIGFVVNDVEKVAERLLAQNYRRSYPKQMEKYRIRDYFLDADGNEYEFVEYLSDRIEEKNSYQ